MNEKIENINVCVKIFTFVMTEIIEMTNKVWDYHDTTQQRLLEARDSATAGLDTQVQN